MPITIQWLLPSSFRFFKNRSVPSEAYFTYWLHPYSSKIQDHMCFSPFIPLEYSKSYPSYHRNNKKTVVAIISYFFISVFRFGNRQSFEWGRGQIGSKMNGSFDSNDRSVWFFGLMTREQAVSKLQVTYFNQSKLFIYHFQGKSFGTFLIRRSPRNPSDDYVLSVAETGKIANYIIHKEQDHYKIGDQIFSDVPQVSLFLLYLQPRGSTKLSALGSRR